MSKKKNKHLTVAQPAEPATAPAPVSLDTHLATFLAKQKSDRTRETYEAVLRVFARWLVASHIPALEVTQEHVEAYAAEMEKAGKAPGTINGALGTLTVFYEHLIRFDVYTKNPARYVDRPAVPAESNREAPSLEQAMDMHDLAAMDPDPRMHLVFCLLFFNALRNEEALQFSLAKLQHKNGRTLYSFIGKGGLPARVTLADVPTLQALDRVRPLLTDPTGPVFGWKRDKLNRLIQSLAERADVRDIHVTPHSLRHAAITIGLDKGMSFDEVQAMARHRNPATTQRYDRHRVERAARVSDGIAGLAIDPWAQTA